MKTFLLVIVSVFLLSSCLNQGAKRLEQQMKEEAENDSIFVIQKPFANDPARIEYEIPVLKGTNLRHGVQKRYYSHGSLYSEIPYTRNERNGIAYTYYKAFKNEPPAVWKEQPYANGKLNGLCKRYYSSGKLQAEYEFKDGLPAIGLKEYAESGEEISMPVLTAKSNPTSKYYYVTAQLSKPNTKTTFYIGELTEGKYMPENLKKIQERDGVAEVLIPRDGGQKTITVVAVFMTRLSNECILAKTIPLK